MTTFDAKIAALMNKLPKILESWGYEVTVLFQGLISKNMGNDGVSDDYRSGGSDSSHSDSSTTWSNSKDNLRLKSGRLISSFRPNTKSTFVDVKSNKIKIHLGSDVEYASVHDKGMFIKATPITTKKGRKTYKMAQYFWAKYYETDKANSFFKIMALSVDKRGGVKIPKRPYFAPALSTLKNVKLKMMLEKLIVQLAKELR